MTPIYLTKSQLPQQLHHLHTGGHIVVYVCESVHVPATAGTWSGGTREVYCAVRLADGRVLPVSDTISAPWNESRQDRVYKLEPGIAVAVTGSFCGKNAGLTIFARQEDIAPALPAPAAELSEAAAKVLEATCAYKSAYRREYLHQAGLRDAQIEAAKAELLALGYLTKQGAVTPAGRNVRTVARSLP